MAKSAASRSPRVRPPPPPPEGRAPAPGPGWARAERGGAAAVLAPGGQALGPGLGLCLREGVGSDALPSRVVLVDPGPEVGGPQLGEGEEEVAEVALGIDHQGGDAVKRRLLEEGQAEAGLSAARHAHAYRMGHEILGVVEEEPIAGLLGSE